MTAGHYNRKTYAHCPTCSCNIEQETFLRDEIGVLAGLVGGDIVRVIGKRRDARSINMRTTVIVALKKLHPEITTTLMGRLVMRDHSTITTLLRRARPEAVDALLRQYQQAKERAA